MMQNLQNNAEKFQISYFWEQFFLPAASKRTRLKAFEEGIRYSRSRRNSRRWFNPLLYID